MKPVAALCLLLTFGPAVGDASTGSHSADDTSSEIGRRYAGRYSDFIPADAKRDALQHISEEQKREAERYASQKKWAGDNTEDMQRVEQEHKETVQRLAKAQAEIEKEFGSSDDSSSSKDSSKESRDSSKKEEKPAVLLASSTSEREAEVSPLVRALKHLADDKQREVERYASQKKWAGDNAEDMQRVEEEHKETMHRLARAQAEIEKRLGASDDSSSSKDSSTKDGKPAVVLASETEVEASPLVKALKHLADDKQREVERYASQKKWAGDNAEDMQRVEEEHQETLKRLAKAQAEIEKKFGSSSDTSSSKDSKEKKEEKPAVVLASEGSSESETEVEASPLVKALKHLAEDKQREVERYASQKKWAGDNAEAMKRVEEEHKETVQRLAKAQAEIEKKFESNGDSSSSRDSSKKDGKPAVLLASAGGKSESDAARATLVQELKHLAAEEQREVERYAAQKKWAGDSAEDMHRVEQQHQETVQRLSKARGEIEKRYADAGSSASDAKTTEKSGDDKPTSLLAGLREGRVPSLSAVAVPSAASGALLAILVQRLWRPHRLNTLTESLLSKEDAV